MPGLNYSSSQDYLKVIYLLGQRRPQKRILTNEIAGRLNLRPASVTGMLARLADDGLVDYQKRRGVRLTAAGEKIALMMVRRHRLIETFLFVKLGYSWDEVHEEAERLEHAVSAEFCQRLEEILDFPANDPHGDPIPNAALDRPVVNHTRLTGLKPGDRAEISRVSDIDPRILRQADHKKLRPGTVVEILPGPEITLRRGGSKTLIQVESALGNAIYVNLF